MLIEFLQPPRALVAQCKKWRCSGDDAGQGSDHSAGELAVADGKTRNGQRDRRNENASDAPRALSLHDEMLESRSRGETLQQCVEPGNIAEPGLLHYAGSSGAIQQRAASGRVVQLRDADVDDTLGGCGTRDDQEDPKGQRHDYHEDQPDQEHD